MADIQPNKKVSEEAAAAAVSGTDLFRLVQGAGTEEDPYVSVKATVANLATFLGTGGEGGSGVVESIVAGPGISVDSTDPANPIVKLAPVAATYRWFRVYITSTPGGDYCAIGEIELRATLGGSDLTSPATPVFANSSFSSTPPPGAVDNVSNASDHCWINNNTGYPTWFALDMGTPRTVVQVAMAPQATEAGTSRIPRSPNAFVIQGSNAATTNVALVTDWVTLGIFDAVTGYADGVLKTFNL